MDTYLENLFHFILPTYLFFRFKEYLRKRPVARPPPISMIPSTLQDSRRPDEVEYYNDLPGKTPPEFSPVQKTRNHKGN